MDFSSTLKHGAYCLETGEIICSNHGNHLKRLVAYSNKWDKKKYHWIFAHGKNEDDVCNKLAQKKALYY